MSSSRDTKANGIILGATSTAAIAGVSNPIRLAGDVVKTLVPATAATVFADTAATAAGAALAAPFTKVSPAFIGPGYGVYRLVKWLAEQ